MVDLSEARAALNAAILANVPFVLVDREWLENALTELQVAREAQQRLGQTFGQKGRRL